MIKYYTRGKEWDENNFEILNSFDGRVVDGNCFLTVLPISPKECREQQADSPVFVQFWKGETSTEFVVTDDWGIQHVLLIPNHMEKVIEDCKSKILSNGLPTNITV